jgi:hypothetical protein
MRSINMLCRFADLAAPHQSRIQGFHGAGIQLPARLADRPDPVLLDERFRTFRDAA